jgi:hypothetical protein
MLRPLVHIGYHKTGTTWLQRHLFGNRGLGLAKPLPMEKIRKVLIAPHALDFDPEACADKLRPRVEATAEGGLVPVLSAERLSGNPTSGGWDSKELAHRVAAVFPHARVLIVIREQRAMITSVYKRYVFRGGAGSVGEYFHPHVSRLRIPLFDFDHFLYHRLIGEYAELLGPDNVLVLPYELFIERPERFVDSVIRFAGATRRDDPAGLPFEDRANVSLSAISIGVMRPFNALFVGEWERGTPPALLPVGPAGRRLRSRTLPLSRRLGYIDALVPGRVARRAETRLRASIEAEIGSRYTQSNALTQEFVEEDLAGLRYAVAGQQLAARDASARSRASVPAA